MIVQRDLWGLDSRSYFNLLLPTPTNHNYNDYYSYDNYHYKNTGDYKAQGGGASRRFLIF